MSSLSLLIYNKENMKYFFPQLIIPKKQAKQTNKKKKQTKERKKERKEKKDDTSLGKYYNLSIRSERLVCVYDFLLMATCTVVCTVFNYVTLGNPLIAKNKAFSLTANICCLSKHGDHL